MAKGCCCCDRTRVRKGGWTPEEDEKLVAYVKKYGHWNWRRLPKFAGLLRCGKSCRLRWLNYLRPDIRRGGFTEEEEETIIGLYAAMGGRWSVMAAQMPGRTDNDIKNHWNTVLKRRVMKQQKIKLMAETSPSHVDGNILSSNANAGVVMEQPYGSTLFDLKALEIVLESVEAFPPAIQSPPDGNMSMQVEEQFQSANPQPPAVSANPAGDFWTDPLWLGSTDTAFDDYQPFGASNFFTPQVEDYLLQEGICYSNNETTVFSD